MKYFEVEFTISPYSADASDLLAALAGEAGFETFEETETGLLGYVQQELFDMSALDPVIQDFPFEGTTITCDVRPAEDRDWNEQWEQEGFEPIVVADRLAIHDGRHLPETAYPIAIEIDAHMAFGTGTHEATKAVGYDIDEWSVDNARHNAVINGVDAHFESLLGDATVLNQVDGQFDLVLANINRNILLADMSQFCTKMAAGAHLILSGFYTADNAQLIGKAEDLGLRLQTKKEDHDWSCLVFSK